MFKRQDWIFGCISLALGAAVLVYCSKHLDTAMSAMDPSGPAAMPRLVAVLMVLIGLAHIIGAVCVMKSDKTPPKKAQGRKTPVIIICAACIAYYFVIEPVGYLFATPLLIAAIMASVGERKVPRIVGMSVGTTLVLFAIFNYVLAVRMPLGLLSGLLG